MAKRRKSSKCPEPFNTLIDLLGGFVMSMIADKMEEKHHYRKRGRINPYRASAFGIASGRLNSTEQLLKMGGFLGAMGSFDDDNEHGCSLPREIIYPFDDSNEYGVSHTPTHDNRYAWRLNCEDGSECGIDPEDYETREEYNLALDMAVLDDEQPEENENIKDAEVSGGLCLEHRDAFPPKLVCRVSLLSTGENVYYLTTDDSLMPGDVVEVIGEEGKTGIVLTVEAIPVYELPVPRGEMKAIRKTGI